MMFHLSLFFFLCWIWVRWFWRFIILDTIFRLETRLTLSLNFYRLLILNCNNPFFVFFILIILFLLYMFILNHIHRLNSGNYCFNFLRRQEQKLCIFLKSLDYLGFHDGKLVLWTSSNLFRKAISQRIIWITLLLAHDSVHRLLVYNFVCLCDHLRSLTLRLQLFFLHLPVNLFLHSLSIYILQILIWFLFCAVNKSNSSLAFLSAVYLDARILLNIKVLHFLLLSQGNIFDVLKLDLLIWVLILVIEDFLWIENTGNWFGIKNIFSLWYLINFIFLCFTYYWSIVFNLRVLRNSFLWSFWTLLCVSIHFIVLFQSMVFCFLKTTVMLNFYLFIFLD